MSNALRSPRRDEADDNRFVKALGGCANFLDIFLQFGVRFVDGFQQYLQTMIKTMKR